MHSNKESPKIWVNETRNTIPKRAMRNRRRHDTRLHPIYNLRERPRNKGEAEETWL
jgi:hypothetical protein